MELLIILTFVENGEFQKMAKVGRTRMNFSTPTGSHGNDVTLYSNHPGMVSGYKPGLRYDVLCDSRLQQVSGRTDPVNPANFHSCPYVLVYKPKPK